MKHLDLFSGIGGFSLAADIVFGKVEHTFVELDPFCQKILRKHWPESQIYEDIKYFYSAERPDIVTGGFPCQPFSTAGKRNGKEDNRYLWPEMLRVIGECKPTWVIGENVAGIISMELEQVCIDLENKGYEVWPVVIPACAVNAPHRRDRVWILAHSSSDGSNDCSKNRQGSFKRSNDNKKREEKVWQFEGCSRPWIQTSGWDKNWQEVITELSGVDDGIPTRLDKNRIKALGNSIVPQVAEVILRHIKMIEK